MASTTSLPETESADERRLALQDALDFTEFRPAVLAWVDATEAAMNAAAPLPTQPREPWFSSLGSCAFYEATLSATAGQVRAFSKRPDAALLHSALNALPFPSGLTSRERFDMIDAAIEKALEPDIGVRASSVKRVPPQFIWAGHIPTKPVLISSNPGYGKSTLSCDIAARISVGRPWPDGSPCEQGGVLLITAEDDSDDTVAPRLQAAHADLTKIVIVEYGTDTGKAEFSLPSGIKKLEAHVKAENVKAIVIDPLEAYLDHGINANNNADLRKVTSPLKALSKKYGAAIIIIGHLTKDSEREMEFRHGGSIAKAAAARAVYAVLKDETLPADAVPEYLLVCGKINGAKMPKPWRYKLAQADGDLVSHVEWIGQVDASAAEIREMSARKGDKPEGSLDAAKSFLVGMLTAGAQLSTAVDTLAATQNISHKTLNRARKELRVLATKKNGAWWIELPTPDPKPAISPDPDEEI